MSRQIQIRRGSAAEHANFTGALGEITLDTDAKTLRVHDGETVGGIALARQDEIKNSASLPADCDVVIETFKNSTGWYRRYKSGCIEQGGILNLPVANTSVQVTLPVAMLNSEYAVQTTYMTTTNSTFPAQAFGQTTTSIKVKAGSNGFVHWEVKGFSAQ